MNTGRENAFGMFGNNGIGSDMFDKNGDNINAFNGAAETPQYLIKSKDIFDSDVNDGDYMETAAPCLGVNMQFARNSTYDSSGENTQDGRLLARPTYFWMRVGGWSPKIKERMFNGIRIEKIEIHRMKIIDGKAEVIQSWEFRNCYVTYFKQDGDVIICAFTYESVIETINMYGSDNKKLGQTSTQYNFAGVCNIA